MATLTYRKTTILNRHSMQILNRIYKLNEIIRSYLSLRFGYVSSATIVLEIAGNHAFAPFLQVVHLEIISGCKDFSQIPTVESTICTERKRQKLPHTKILHFQKSCKPFSASSQSFTINNYP